ncbi:MAG: peptide ABC transporter substrate-binding protein [Gammaproteobacteria bacterium]|nr:peptide ABC transporter substrate-binding protein [Gammaproteobacteria bacterium]
MTARRDRRVRVTAALAALVSIAMIALFAARAPRPASAPHGRAAPGLARTLRRGIGAEPESLDPAAARSEAALTVLRDLFEGLTELGPGGTPILAAADHSERSPDGLTYVFHLRAGGRWSNGRPVVAADFVAAWRRLVDPATGSQYSGLLAPVRNAVAIEAGRAAPSTLGVRAQGDSTLIVELAHPTPYFLALVAHPATFPIYPPSLARYGARWVKPGILVSNGAFVLRRWVFGSHLVASRNRYYWHDAATRLDRIEFYTATDPEAELRAYRAGDLDITATIPPDDLRWVESRLPGQLHVAPELAVYYLGFNLIRPPFAGNPILRRALSMVIDRRTLVDRVTAGGEQPAYTLVPPGMGGYQPPAPAYARLTMRQRIARAQRLLRKAGLAGKPLRVELRYNTDPLHDRVALAVAAMWRQALGVDVRLRAEDYKVLVQDIDRATDTEVFRASWVADYDDPYSFLQLLQSGFGINLTRYSNPAYDALLRRAQGETDSARRAVLLARAERLMLRDQPVAPLFFYVAKHLVNPRIHGWRDDVTDVVYDKYLYKVR